MNVMARLQAKQLKHNLPAFTTSSGRAALRFPIVDVDRQVSVVVVARERATAQFRECPPSFLTFYYRFTIIAREI